MSLFRGLLMASNAGAGEGLKTSRKLFFLMVLHPVSGWSRVGNAYPSAKAAGEWRSFVRSAWRGLPVRTATCTVRFVDGKITAASRKVLSEKFNLDVDESAQPVKPAAPAAAQTHETVVPSAEPASVADHLKTCPCRRCVRERGDQIGGLPAALAMMIVCPTCGNKRCPHANDHRHECTGSNEPGQPGSAYATPTAQPPTSPVSDTASVPVTPPDEAYWSRRAQQLLSVPVPDDAPTVSGQLGGVSADRGTPGEPLKGSS